MNLKKIEKISKALGDANRLKILNHIAKSGGTGHCSAIQDCIDLAQPSISHHIRILIEAELIEAEKEGRNHKYIFSRHTYAEYINELNCLIIPCEHKKDS